MKHVRGITRNLPAMAKPCIGDDCETNTGATVGISLGSVVVVILIILSVMSDIKSGA